MNKGSDENHFERDTWIPTQSDTDHNETGT